MQRRTGELRERACAAATSALGCALLAGAIVVQGCGQKSGSGRQAALAAPAAGTPASAPAVTSAEAVKPMVASPGTLEAGAVGVLPPDLKITVADTLVILLGFSWPAVQVLFVFNMIYSSMVHANLNWTFGPLRYLLASPVFHTPQAEAFLRRAE